ncbi:MAG: magnesium transporter CorA [Methanomassiliicoccales archaeon]|jgi:magnesium transporter|nr:magnesium transporter CorA [Methanomassiliicoccales archaeon]
MNDSVHAQNNASVSGGTNYSNEKPKGICVALVSPGKTVKFAGSSPDDFISIIRTSVLSWVNFATDDLRHEGNEIAVKFGFTDSLVQTLLSGYYATFEDHGTEMGIMLPAVRAEGLELKVYPLIILIRDGLIVTMHSKEVARLVVFARYADGFLRKLPESASPQDKLTLMLIRIIDESNSRNFEHLREIEELGDKLSETLVDPKSPRMTIGRQIYEIKHALITYLNTLWRTLDVLHSLRYGDADLVTDNPKVLSKIGLLADEVNRQIELSEHMSEVLASGLEVLQSLYNNQLQILNNRMALVMTWLTILGTAVLVPNTLATIFSFAFGLESKLLLWSVLILIISTINATFLAYWWVRRRVIITAIPEETDKR